jgi:hypothetical protein
MYFFLMHREIFCTFLDGEGGKGYLFIICQLLQGKIKHLLIYFVPNLTIGGRGCSAVLFIEKTTSYYLY